MVLLFLCGGLPEEFMRANLGARLLALKKKNGKLRPVACGSVIRRLAARALCEVAKDEICSAVGKHQFAVGRAAGCEVVHKCITALTETNPEVLVLAYDATNAFNSIPRGQVLSGVRSRAPTLLTTVEAWLSGATTHTFWDGQGNGLPVHASSGVDQGCPLSPALFAIGIAGALDGVNSRLAALSSDCRLFSYLDDVMVIAPRAVATQAHAVVQEELSRAGLTLNVSKTQAWTAHPGTTLPEGLASLRVESLTCLGSTVPWMERSERNDEDGDGRVRVHRVADGAAILKAARAFTTRLAELQAAGLSLESAFTLLRAYAQGCVVHLLRASLEGIWPGELDNVFFQALERIVDAPLDDTQRWQATMRLRDGGCGFPCARHAAARAYIDSWALVLKPVAECLGIEALEGFRARCPRTMAALLHAEAEVESIGGKGDEPFDWTSCLSEPRAKVQGSFGEQASEWARERLLLQLDEDGRLAFRGAGGTGAGAFLLPREETRSSQTRVVVLICVFAFGCLCALREQSATTGGRMARSVGRPWTSGAGMP